MASLAAHQTFMLLMTGESDRLALIVAVAAMVGIGVMTVASRAGRRDHDGPVRRRTDGVRAGARPEAFATGLHDVAPTITVLVIAMLLSAIAALSADLTQWHDPASRLVRESGESFVVATLRVSTPATVSDLRDADCQTDAALRSLATGTVIRPSVMPVRLFASGRDCAALADGAALRVRGTLQEARFGKRPLWIVAERVGSDRSAVDVIRAPTVIARTIAHMRQSFFDVTERLSDQGRVLVPGLTLGVLGQDHVNVVGGVALSTEDTTRPVSGAIRPSTVDDTYAGMVEDQFRRSGIMHLMAVSGGHFLLVADLVRRLCARLLLPRRFVAGCVAAAYLMLAATMYPSDSVLRALVMGLFGAAAMFVGRRGQSMSALSWTVIGVVLADPAMARSYGFALSCAAVLGIVLFSGPIGERLGALLPRFVAEPLAMTVAAQSLTLPIQILMEPELPLASVPANLLVSPFVGFATIAGLASLLVSWASPQCGFALAWIASCGTQVMERVAAWLASGRYAVIPWGDALAGGPSGNLPAALLMLAVEASFAAMFIHGVRRLRRLRDPDPGLPGEPFRPSPRTRIALWFAHTTTFLEKGWKQ
ncbi:ComEC/Rec2 family competence protein [Bifidobacterium aerophilum]|nr:ComEC/Rec2 family competence protein [Bifidobacterium aerophilum]